MKKTYCLLLLLVLAAGITVTAQPVANNDDYTLFAGETRSLNVVLNDTPGSCTTASVEIISPPTTGTALASNNNITYTASGTAPYTDILTYRINCDGIPSAPATVTVNVVTRPIPVDMQGISSCTGPVLIDTPQDFQMQIAWQSPVTDAVSQFTQPLVGDLDGDDIPEIVTFSSIGRYTGAGNDNYGVKRMLVYDGRSGSLKRTIELPFYYAELGGAGFGLLKLPSGQRLIVTALSDNYLYAYDITRAEGAEQVWKSDQPYATPGTAAFTANVGFADFNHDGHPEVYLRNTIFDAETGVLLATASGSNLSAAWGAWSFDTRKLSSPIAADLLDDVALELVLGNEIHAVTITNRTGTAGNAITLLRTITPPVAAIPVDGHVQVADFTGDGHLDILISNRSSLYQVMAQVYVYLWDVHNNQTSTPITINTNYRGKGLPLIGDINNDGTLDIVFTTSAGIRAYTYNTTTHTFTPLWNNGSIFAIDQLTDGYSLGAVLFDFDFDGLNELVIANKAHLIIYRTIGTSAPTLLALLPLANSNMSGKYPMVVDADGDGMAEIVVIGTSQLFVVESHAGSPLWAAGRPVWNQFHYHAAAVNRDLTIPQYQVNSATPFAGADGNVGTTDDVRPYNGFLMQPTLMSVFGTPTSTVPRGEIIGARFNYRPNTDVLTVTVDVKNRGSRAFISPFRITLYKDAIGNAVKHTHEHNGVIYPGETVSVTFEVPNFIAGWSGFTQLALNINDNGNSIQQDQYACPLINSPLMKNGIITSDDYVNAFIGYPKKVIDATSNDILPTTCTKQIEILQNPTHGAATVVDGKIEYITTATQPSSDLLRYKVSCTENPAISATATIHISLVSKPDNISDSECYLTPNPTVWGIKELARAPVTEDSKLAYCGSSVMTGDIDNDGLVEMVVWGHETALTPTTYPHPNYVKKMLIYEYHNDGTIALQQIIPLPYTDANLVYTSPTIANVDGGQYAAIFFARGNRHLYKYTYNAVTGNYEEAWNQLFSTNVNYDNPTPIVADFNGLGRAQVNVYDKIYDAVTGTLLVDAGFIGQSGYAFGSGGHGVNAAGRARMSSMAVGDVDGDGTLELVGGDCVYKITIADPTGANPGNSMQLIQRANPGFHTLMDGSTALVDMDLDGQLDAIVSVAGTSPPILYVYNPRTGEVMHTNKIYTGTTEALQSMPFVGDIDGDGYPEITITSALSLRAYKLNLATKTLDIFWSLPTTDKSGATTLTLFDFNQDKRMELLYRDETTLRIIDGRAGLTPAQRTLANISKVFSYTVNEYPSIADVNNDGQAEIIVTGNVSTTFAAGGQVRVFAALDPVNNPWAPTRTVWNTMNYNAVNVNEDLTIPRYPLNPATVFPGDDGLIGTADDVRPYNACLQQQTFINHNGMPIWVVSKPVILQNPHWGSYRYHAGSGTLVINNLRVRNDGDAPLAAPLYVSAYKNNTLSAATLLSTTALPEGLAVGETKTFNGVTFTGITEAALPQVLLRINDKGFEIAQPTCDPGQTTGIAKKQLWKGDVSTDWNTQGNWTGNFVPFAGDDVEFATETNNPVTPGIPTSGAAINDLHLPTGGTPVTIGSLENQSDKALVIPSTASLTVTGSVVGSESPDKADKIQVQASPHASPYLPNGTLILAGQPCDRPVYGSVLLYARGAKLPAPEQWTDNIPGSPTLGQTFVSKYRWQHIGLPVAALQADPSFHNGYLRSYDETHNAPGSFYHKWTNLGNTSILEAFKGYELTQDAPTTYLLKGALQHCDRTLTLTRRAPAVAGASGVNMHYGLGQNVFGNSYTAAIKIDQMLIPAQVERTVYLYNTGSFQDWTSGTVSSTATAAGNYLAVPVDAASAIHDNQIPSLQGFLMKFTEAETTFNAPDANVTLKYLAGGVVPNTRPQRAKRHAEGEAADATAEVETSEEAPLPVLTLKLESASTVDQLWLIRRPQATPGFDNGWDGRKYFGTPTAFLYTSTPDGPMQVNTSQTIEGTMIDFYANGDTDYTLVLTRKNLEGYDTDNLHLIDLEARRAVPLTDEVTHYAFKASARHAGSKRFLIANRPDIDDKNLLQGYFNGSDALVTSNYTGEAGTLRVVSAAGQLVMSFPMPTGTTHHQLTRQLPDGVYVLHMTAAGKHGNSKGIVTK